MNICTNWQRHVYFFESQTNFNLQIHHPILRVLLWEYKKVVLAWKNLHKQVKSFVSSHWRLTGTKTSIHAKIVRIKVKQPSNYTQMSSTRFRKYFCKYQWWCKSHYAKFATLNICVYIHAADRFWHIDIHIIQHETINRVRVNRLFK